MNNTQATKRNEKNRKPKEVANVNEKRKKKEKSGQKRTVFSGSALSDTTFYLIDISDSYTDYVPDRFSYPQS